MFKPAIVRVRRQGALGAVLAQAARTSNYANPWDEVYGVWESYSSEGEILRELHAKWRTELAGAVFLAIERGNGDLVGDVASAYAAAAARHPALKRILDANAEHAAIAAAVRKERALLSAAGAALSNAA